MTKSETNRGVNDNIENSKTYLEILPQGKRKHKIIFRALFSADLNEQQGVEKMLAYTIGKMGVFDK